MRRRPVHLLIALLLMAPAPAAAQASGGVTTPTGGADPGGPSSGAPAGWGSAGSSRNSFWIRAAVSGFPWGRLRSSVIASTA